MDLLNLYGEAGILLLDGIANALVLCLVLLVFLSHHVIAILDRFLYLLLPCLCKLELHYRIVLELRLANDVQATLCF